MAFGTLVKCLEVRTYLPCVVTGKTGKLFFTQEGSRDFLKCRYVNFLFFFPFPDPVWCSRKRDLVRIAFCFLGNRWGLAKRQLPVPTMSTYPCPALHPCRNFLGSLPPSQPASSGPCCPVMCMIVSLSCHKSQHLLIQLWCFFFTRLPCEV